MDTSTGKIYKDFNEGKAIDEEGKQKKIDNVRAKFMKRIPEEFLPKLQGMNRKERREFYKKHKKEFGSVKQGK